MSSVSETARARLYTRAGCGLCERAATVLARLADEGLLSVEQVDIARDAALRDWYGDRIPVVVLSTGDVFEGRISEFRLRRALGRHVDRSGKP